MDENGVDIIGNGRTQDDLFNEKTINCDKENNEVKDENDALINATGASGSDIVARMPVEKYSAHYNMNHKYRGKAMIFNHEIFQIANLKPRAGTQEDCRNLKAVLAELGFEVHVYLDLKLHEIESHIRDMSKLDHTHNDCFLIAVLSHGDSGIIYSKDSQYKPDILWSRFTADRCPTLAGKPKIFLLQACQGDKLDGGVILSSRTETDGQMLASYRIPSQADFLVVYSTVKGYYSWRNTTRGSWFIQALCEELKNRAYTLDFLSILTFVSRRVAFDFESNVPDTPSMHQQKQIPCIMSMLTRMIQFNEKVGFSSDIIQTKEKSKHVFSGIFSKGKTNC